MNPLKVFTEPPLSYTFKLEYSDYIDLAKLLKILPSIGAIAGIRKSQAY